MMTDDEVEKAYRGLLCAGLDAPGSPANRLKEDHLEHRAALKPETLKALFEGPEASPLKAALEGELDKIYDHAAEVELTTLADGLEKLAAGTGVVWEAARFGLGEAVKLIRIRARALKAGKG